MKLRKCLKQAVKRKADTFIEILVSAGIAEKKSKKRSKDKIDS